MSGPSAGRPRAGPKRAARAADRGAAAAWLTFALFSISVVLLALPGSSVGHSPAADGRDPSWTQAIGQAFKDGRRLGSELVFSYGPLGYFFHPTSAYDGDLIRPFIAFQLLIGLLSSVLLVACVFRLESILDRLVFFALLFLFAAPYSPVVLYPAVAATVVLGNEPPRLLARSPRRELFVFAILAFLALLSLGKFTLLLLALVAVAALVVGRSSTLGARALWIPLTFLLALAGLWIGVGQRLADLPLFFQRSLDLARSYSVAFTLSYDGREIALALLFCGGLVVLTLVGLAGPRRSRSHAAAAMAVLAVAFFGWKQGFVRQDAHSLEFFRMAPALPFLIPALGGQAPRSRIAFRSLRVALAALAVFGLFAAGQRFGQPPASLVAQAPLSVKHRLAWFGSLDELRAMREQELQALRLAHDLPRVRELVADESIDVLSDQVGTLLLNRFNWSPRPVFQSYAAVSDSLLALNGEFFDRDGAPGWVLLKLSPIDRRLPMMSDSQALLALLRHYRPQLEENGYLLLRRREGPAPEPGDPRILVSEEIALDRPVDLGVYAGRPYLLSLELRRTALGKLLTLAYRFPEVHLKITTVTGSSRRYRIIPGMTKSPFLLNPLVRSTRDFSAVYGEGPSERVASISVSAGRILGIAMLEPTARMTLLGFETPDPEGAPTR